MIANQYLEVYRKKRFLETSAHDKIISAANEIRNFEIVLRRNRLNIKSGHLIIDDYLVELDKTASNFFKSIKEACSIYKNNKETNNQMVKLSIEMVDMAIICLNEKLDSLDNSYQDDKIKKIVSEESQKLAA